MFLQKQVFTVTQDSVEMESWASVQCAT